MTAKTSDLIIDKQGTFYFYN